MSHPPAEISLTAEQVDRLIAAQHPSRRGTLELVAHGWDNDLFRLGDELAVRLPRRAAAAELVEHEQRWLPLLAPRLPVPVPTPVAVGVPDGDYPWAWSIVPWFTGHPAIADDPADRDALAEQLAEVLVALHEPAPADAPANPFRGVPLAARDEAMRTRLAPHPVLLAAWTDALAAPPWAGPPLWLHGDLHPGNVLVDGATVTAVIDFGDITAGDPAADLSAGWLFFTAAGRERFRAQLGARYDAASWRRARGWAAAFAGAVVGIPESGFAGLAEHVRRELAADEGAGSEEPRPS
ncbi:aminoglycoside phosphotransferase family protein [Protaetiibacter larvae]|uniref:Aminoglycoside phosphotransferase family protein n=1 Tax=Protaetiibacter larvae TaxID=2592654 RepID=A0A5C1Y5X2_9MICO|nr:aminoglycoside phosphotransferase family protein [Protaetiibacter larvae]QEO09191.1 aminoglycoside phosphotransferase family protein [Protaetiibacter larvae]